jgi:oligopeptide/dipeptide ABC transporter ATP-binding protein
MTTSGAPPLIELRDVSKTFASGILGRDRHIALEPFSFTIDVDHPGIIAVVGESGSGKTTLARLLLGLVEPSGGEVLFKGRDLRRLSTADRRDFRHTVQAIFQDPYEVYNPFYRVDHVLTTPVRKFGLAHSKAAARELIEQALQAVGLQPEEILGRYPHQLSGGQRQRIMVARALLLRPRLIVADEPVSMVDASLRATILGSLRKLHQELGISILYITHDLATAYQVADTILVLYRASVVEAGDVELVVKDPRHPYTQLLIGSIPKVSTIRDWAEEQPPTPAAVTGPGCKFADRCPVRLPVCLEQRPPLYRTAPRRAAACVRLSSDPVLAASDFSGLLAPGPRAPRVTPGLEGAMAANASGVGATPS